MAPWTVERNRENIKLFATVQVGNRGETRKKTSLQTSAVNTNAVPLEYILYTVPV